MNKIDFTDIYKFLVSIGVAIIVFSILLPYLIFSSNFSFILKPQEILELSPTAQTFVNYQQSYLLQIAKNYFAISLFLLSLGVALTVGGMWGWYKRQQLRDTKEDTETKRAKLDWEKIERRETREKLIEDLKVYFNYETQAPKEIVEAPEFEYILAKYTGTKHSLIDVFSFINSYVQKLGYQLLFNWKLDLYTYDVVIEPIKNGLSSQKPNHILSIRYAEDNPSKEWLEKVLADLWLSSNFYKDFNKTGRIDATLIVISPSKDLDPTINTFMEQLQSYWRNGINLKVLGMSDQEIDKLYKNYQNAYEALSKTEDLNKVLSNTKDLNDEREIRKGILEQLFTKIDPEFINELQTKHEELHKNMIKKEGQARLLGNFLKRIALILAPLIFIISGLVWGLKMYGYYLINAVEAFQIYLINHNISIILISIVVIIIAVLYNITIRTNKISGSLTFVDGSTNIAEFGLYSGVNFRKIKKRELDDYPQLMLKSMKVKNIGKKRRSATKGAETTDTFYSDEQQGIRIDCVSSRGRKFSVDLYPKTPSIYSEETFAQMIYEPIE